MPSLSHEEDQARRRKCLYLKNTDETYIKLDATPEPSLPENFINEIAENIQSQTKHYQQQRQQQQQQQQQLTPSEEKIFVVDKPDTLFAGASDESHNENQQPVTRADKMIEQLTDGLMRMTLHQDTSKFHDNVTPWRNYGDFVRWTPEPHLPSYYTAPIDMPSRQTQEHLISVFFSRCQHISPTISRRMFYDQLRIKGPLITPLLLNAMYAHAAKHVDNPAFRSQPENPATQGDLFYNRARRLVDDFLDVPRLSTVIALLYMASYDYDMPENESRIRSSRTWMYSGMAVRMCLELGLHTANYSSQMSQFDVELRKRVLWTCYVVDKLESCTMERPWMLKSKDIALDFPTPLPEDDVQERLVMEGFGQLCRLMILIEKVIHFIAYDTKNRNIWTMNEENQTLQFLEAITQWREMLPDDLKWAPTSGQFLNMPASAVVTNLHLVCYNLELSLLMCCRFQEEGLQRARRRSLANTITHIVSLTVQHHRLMYTYALSTFSGIFAALTHAADFDHPALDVAAEAKMQFRKCLEDVRAIVERVPVRDMRNFARLVDLTLQPQTPLASLASSSASCSYATAFSAISDLCHKEDDPVQRVLTPDGGLFADQRDAVTTTAAMLDTSKALLATTAVPFPNISPTTRPYAFVPSHFAFDTSCVTPIATTVATVSSSSSSSSAAAAAAAAAAAVGAVGTPGTAADLSNKNIEPADYTFELISVADEWARSLIY
ncbi:hypothetical protein DFQ28_003009 [Apophysomyces sp. BC1034]|nr:hypothetical protein DFQ29_004138 [Apophysomyces sp. BC1021]KAG0193857.1 hypothetical protein DFQ28_003009 [Apophysomyces sp. BC1034]